MDVHASRWVVVGLKGIIGCKQVASDTHKIDLSLAKNGAINAISTYKNITHKAR